MNFQPDMSEAERFLRRLDNRTDEFTFQTFDDAKGNNDKRHYLSKVLHGTLDQHCDELIELNRQGAGIFVMVNTGDGNGRRIENVIGIRAIWRDLDEPVSVKPPFDSHMIVETSGGKFHEYYLVTPEFSREDHANLMGMMVKQYGSDKNAKDLARVLRLPGFYHLKNPDLPVQVRLVSVSDQPPYGRQALLDILSKHRQPASPAAAVSSPVPAPVPAAAVSSPVPAPVPAAALVPQNPSQQAQTSSQSIAEGNRNSTLFQQGAALRGAGHDQETILTKLLVSNEQRCDPPLTVSEVKTIAQSAAKYPPDPPKTSMMTVEEAMTLTQDMDDESKKDPGWVFQPEILASLVVLRSQKPDEFARKWASLKKSDTPLRNLNQQMKVIEGEYLPKEEQSVEAITPYVIRNNQTYLLHPGTFGPVEERLTNFAATITEEITLDDGFETTTEYVIEDYLYNGKPLKKVQITASDFTKMNWLHQFGTASAMVYVVHKATEHLRCAIQQLSEDSKKDRVVYRHIGWRFIDLDWYYLNGNGVISATGTRTDITVQPHSTLQSYALPQPPQPDRLVTAVKAALQCLEVHPIVGRLGLMMVARAPLNEALAADFSLFSHGITGCGKTTMAMLFMAFFGDFKSNPPANWESTDNALEYQCNQAKDALLLIDDFKPRGGQHEVSRLHAKADRIFRTIGNQSGRDRLNSKIEMRAKRPPQALVLATGEDIPRGESLRGRMLIVGVEKSEVNWKAVTTLQKAAREGLLADCMAAYLQWLAPQMTQLKTTFRESVSAWRDQVKSSHARHADMIGNLMEGLKLFKDFVETSLGHSSSNPLIDLDEAKTILHQILVEQKELLEESDECERFIALLRAAFVSGQAYLDGLTSSTANSPQMLNLGWHRSDDPKETTSGIVSKGKRIGWYAGNDRIYLESESAYAVIERLAVAQGNSIGLSSKTLFKRMNSKGLLSETEEERTTVRKKIGTKQIRVLVLSVTTIYPEGEPSDEECRLENTDADADMNRDIFDWS